ncbi:unnamed protein product [Adineta ricciae]|uniref:beta-N-acetylhexosaminidase n=1 Tax=Adineta ricciae TaxID=249248 RepID=A0A813TUI3_ADIRI|nr:unnamed protein product [Adineta ricciae]
MKRLIALLEVYAILLNCRVICEITVIEVKYPLEGQRSPPNAVWPHPQQINASLDLLYIRPHDITIFSNIATCDIIAKAIERYDPLLFPPKLTMREPPSSADNILQSVSLNIRDDGQCEKYIQQTSNESYTLTISQQIAIVESTTVWGLLRGLETFSQLVYINKDNYVVINSTVSIVDGPRFHHRGVMLDSSRHFLPVSIIKKNLDVMSYNKLNVFHWHLVDDQSFPFESEAFPELSAKGAFSADHVYTPSDVADVIEHARLRGIRVIPEIDTPGHTFSWSKSMPQLITVCWANGKPYQAIYGVQGEMEIFNPSVPRVYTVMNTILREMHFSFASLGMDEVYDKCWLSNPNISQWMQAMNITNAKGLHTYYAERILNIMRNISAVPIVWQDVWDEKVELPQDTIVQVWKDTSDNSEFDTWASYLNQVAGQGYNVILSSPWYLNYISYGKYNTNTSVMNLEFFKYYEVEPLREFNGSDEAKNRILGGEACMWGEFVDGTNLLSRLWPKASAVAERLWSAASVNKSEDAQFRLDVHRCRLLRRGIPAQPLLNGYCGNYELGMGRSMINYPAFNYENSNSNDSTTTAATTATLSQGSTDRPSSASEMMRTAFFSSSLLFYFLTYVSSEIEFIAVRYPLQGQRSPPNAVWPHPQQINASLNLLYIRPNNLTINSNIRNCDIISNATQRYNKLFFPPKLTMREPPSGADNILQSVSLNIRGDGQCEKYIQQTSNESYTLTISQQIAIVESTTVWGLLRGLETFSQLVYINKDNYVVINSTVSIVDGPRFHHRGVMLDSSRHFLPVSIIKKNLDVMSYNKLNVFHWHLVDDQSFPFESEEFPELSAKGAFSADHVYTPSDVADVIEHARLRGIRVIPEIDTPGHTHSWSKSMPQLLTVCWANGKPYQAIYGVQGEMEVFNPSEPHVYTVMETLLREVKQKFPSNYIHLGMDEVYDKCWLSNPNVSAWMQAVNITSTKGLHAYYADRVLSIMRNIDSIPIVWQDVWDEQVELPTGTIIQVWKGADNSWASYLDNAAKQGYNVILSTPWYLNYISYGKYNTNTSVMNLEFFKYYEIEPLMKFTGTEEEKKRILGGEACIWGEFIDSTNILTTLWPRASAVAERLWSAASVNNSEDAQFRLDVHRCRLLRRGIPAQPILNGYCGNYELGMAKSMINDPVFNYDESVWVDVIITTAQSSSTKSTVPNIASPIHTFTSVGLFVTTELLFLTIIFS